MSEWFLDPDRQIRNHERHLRLLRIQRESVAKKPIVVQAFAVIAGDEDGGGVTADSLDLADHASYRRVYVGNRVKVHAAEVGRSPSRDGALFEDGVGDERRHLTVL